MTNASSQLEPEALQLWKARPALSLQQWRGLYADLQSIYMQIGSRPAGAGNTDDFSDFFVQHVVETTPSSPSRVGWLCEIMREFIEDRASAGEMGWTLSSLPAPSTHHHPPLEQVERLLYRTSDRFLFETAADAPGRASGDASESEPELAVRIQRILADSDRSAPELGVAAPHMPTALEHYLARKVAAIAAFGEVERPCAGQIVAIETLTGPAGELEEDVARPLCALIDRPTDTPDVLWGWMVGAEPDYACEADFVLTDEDEPRDPIAATVQLWNPVRVYWPTVARVVGQLSPRRLFALRAVAADFLTGAGGLGGASPAAIASANLVERRTEDGDVVLSGTAMEGEADPRALYQTMYIGAADVLMRPALQAEAAWAADLRACWLEDAEVRALGVFRFLVSSRHDPARTVQLVFEAPGSPDSLVLLQRHGESRDDAPLGVDGHRIEFNGGIARPNPVQMAALARRLQLPAPFDDWATASAQLAALKGATGAASRTALEGLLALAKRLAKSSFEVFAFAFGDWAASGAQSATRGSSTRDDALPDVPVLIASIGSATLTGLSVGLLMPGPSIRIDTVEVSEDGRSVVPPRPVHWVEPGEVLRIEGLSPDPTWTARAQLRGGHLHIELTH